MSEKDSTRLLERAQAILSIGKMDGAELLRGLPDALDVALREKTGLIAFGFSP